MTKRINIHDAKTHLSRYVRELQQGLEAEVVIAVGGKPAARLIAYQRSSRPLGLEEGLFEIPTDFDAPDARIVELFGGPLR
jgi:antitoxin (DNA-binding transcriptional repressor) of toxin-antitoxin stability system